MLKNTISQCTIAKDKRLAVLSYLLLVLFVVISLTLVCVARPGKKATAAPSVHQSDLTAQESSKQAILQWMKENSNMPEYVLMKIYHVAMKSVNADLILAVCLVESNFNPHVESDKGAIGLMGIMPDVWLEELEARGIVNERDDLFSIPHNIASGAYVLGKYLEKTDDLKAALNRYAGGDPSYATRVLQMMKQISMTRRSGQLPNTVGLQS